MIFWHLGATLAVVRYAFRDPAMDLRFLAVGAVLADVIDKPVGSVVWNGGFGTGRLWGHALLFPLTLLIVVMVITRRGAGSRKQWLGLPIGGLMHLVLDGVWTDPETFLWPVLGWRFPTRDPSGLGALISELVTDPWILAGEAVGLLYLGYLWRKGLRDPGARRLFWKTGSVPFPR